MSGLRDRILLIVTAMLVGALLLMLAATLERTRFRLVATTILFWGSVATFEFGEIRRRPSRFRRLWPLVGAWLILTITYLIVLNWATARFGFDWRAGELVVAMLVALGIWQFVRNRVYRY